jgi:hypothetical protein
LETHPFSTLWSSVLAPSGTLTEPRPFSSLKPLLSMPGDIAKLVDGERLRGLAGGRMGLLCQPIIAKENPYDPASPSHDRRHDRA